MKSTKHEANRAINQSKKVELIEVNEFSDKRIVLAAVQDALRTATTIIILE